MNFSEATPLSSGAGEDEIQTVRAELAEAQKTIIELQGQLEQTRPPEATPTGYQGEARLREQAGLLDLTYDAVFVRALDGTIRHWNWGAEAMYGWSAAEALGRKTSELLRTVYPVSFEHALAATLEHGHWEGELVHARRDGSSIVVESRWAIERDQSGEPVAVLEINTDITEQKHRAEELLRLHERLRAQAAQLDEILSASPDHFYTFDREGRYLYVNHAAAEAMGLPPAKMVGKTWRELGFPSDIMSAFAANLEKVFSTGQTLAGEVKFPARGGLRDYEYLLSPIHDGSGGVGIVLATVRDITERRRVENELRLSREQLRAYSRLLVSAIENERRGIARELHDETGQALTSLMIRLGLLQRDPDCPATFGPRLEELKNTVNEVLDGLHRLTMDLRPGALDKAGLVPALEQYTEMFQHQTGIEVQFASSGLEEDRLPPEMETNLYRVVQESLTNVARHAGAQEVSIILERRDGRILLMVEDDGVGFDIDDASKKGRLGLVGIRERAEMMGGKLQIESVRGAGTTLYLRMPYPN